MEEKACKRVDEGLDSGLKTQNGRNLSIIVREFKYEDNPEVQKIFYEGMMEMITDTAFRGLRFHPESLLLYAALTGKIYIMSCFSDGFYGRLCKLGTHTYKRSVSSVRVNDPEREWKVLRH